MQTIRWPALLALALLMLPLTALAGQPARLQQIDTEAVPMTSLGAYGAARVALSGDGSVVVFRTSRALVAEDLNDTSDIYVLDRNSGELEVLGSPEPAADVEYAIGGAHITADGRYVIFPSSAPYYVDGDTNAATDVFRYDRTTGVLERLNRNAAGDIVGGVFLNAITTDGRYVVIRSSEPLVPADGNGELDYYILDVLDGTVDWLHPRSVDFQGLTLSDDGRYAAFFSLAADLVENDTNEEADVFVLDRETDSISRVSVTSGGQQADDWSSNPSISADGRYVVFHSLAANLSPTGNTAGHVYVRDLEAGTIEQIDVSSDGEPAAGSFLTTSQVVPAARVVSSDGRYVVFNSAASNLIPNDTNGTDDVFRRDRQTGTTELVSRSVTGVVGESFSREAIISADGAHVAFASEASNLVYFDEDDGLVQGYGDTHVYLRDMTASYPPDPFTTTHARTDLPVAEGQAQRTWIWGPEPFTEIIYEPYGASNSENILPFEHRQVQYFDKSRMEITTPIDDPNSVWYTTNGLLVVEMMTGELQVSDSGRLQLAPAHVNVAGDADDPHGPTYAGLASLRDAVPHPAGQPITARVDRDGNVTTDASLASFDVQIALVDDVTGHAIATPFWEFMNTTGTVWNGSAYVQDQLFENPYFATGRPLIEAYWAEVLVGGEPREVLMQCFERRCLTYTPGNPDGFIVEAGNVGRHYYDWRYTVQPVAPELSGAFIYTDGLHLNGVDANGPRVLYAAPAGFGISAPEWSPDRTRIAFVLRESNGHADLYVIDSFGTQVSQLTFDDNVYALSWSPDGERLVFESAGMITLVNADGSGRTDVVAGTEPAWSPLGDRIAYIDPSRGREYLMTVNLDGSDPVEVVGAHIDSRGPDASFNGYGWSPDGSRFVYAYSFFNPGHTVPIYRLHTINADGTSDSMASGAGSMGHNPGWSPDGSRLTYIREHVVYSADLNGSDVRGLLWDFSYVVNGFDWAE